MSNIKISQCPFSAKHCKWCGELYCSDREYETPKVTVRTYNTNNTINMEQKELTAQEIVEKLIDEQKISGKEAVILLNAINKPRTPGIIRYRQNLNLVPKECYESGGTCINPNMDCMNCPKYYNECRTNTTSREIPDFTELTMKEK